MPGWADVRLLAPHSELRLLVCGQGSLIDAHRLRCVLDTYIYTRLHSYPGWLDPFLNPALRCSSAARAASSTRTG